MFKSVEYRDFEGCPQLQSVAQKATRLLSGEVRSWRKDVVVIWQNTSNAKMPLELRLELALENGVAASAHGAFQTDEILDDDNLRSRGRRIWVELLDQIIEKLMVRVKASLEIPLEV